MGMDGTREREAFIALGSNLGDREDHLRRAVRLLDEHPGIRVERCSDLYETDPVGYTEQPPFLNMAVRVRTVLPPEALLQTMLSIERKLGRVRDIRWGPRTVDLDLLLYGDLELDTPELVVPHPRMMERPFVLVPLMDVIDEPRTGKPAQAAAALQSLGKEGVRRWKGWRNGSELFAN